MIKRHFSKLFLLFSILLVLTACSEKEDGKEISKKQDEQAVQEVVQTFLMYSETNTTEDDISMGDLYIKTMNSENDKIASDVLNDQYTYIQANDSVLFLTSDYDLYEYKKGKDKEKIASDVTRFEGGYANNLIFYQNEEDDLYIVSETRESEKIASAVGQIDMIGSDLYYLNYDGNLQVYNIESRKEISLESSISYFELLNTDGDFIYTNDDSMLFYKQKDEEAIKISSKEVNDYFIEQVDTGFVYMAYEDEGQVLYQTSYDGLETIKIAADVDTYELKNDHVVYLTYDDNLFMKSIEDEAALKLASDVSYFTVSEDVIFYADVDDTVFTVTDAGEKTKMATQVQSIQITADHELIYGNETNELFLGDEKLATDIDGYALFANNLAYATTDDKLYFMDNLGETVVVEDDLSKYSVVTYQNETIFTNYLSFSDLSGDWEMTTDGEKGIAHITADGTLSNDLFGTTIKLEMIYAGYNYMDVMYNEEYGRVDFSGDSFVLTDDYYEIYFKKITKADKVAKKEEDKTTEEKVDEKEEKSTESAAEKTSSPIKIDLDTVPVPGADNAVESTRDQISYVIYYYLETYTDLDTTHLDVYIHPSSAFYSDQKKYMETLNSRDVEIELLNHTITSIDELAANKYKVTVQEEYSIYDPDKGFSEPTQTSHYTVELIDGSFYITAFSF